MTAFDVAALRREFPALSLEQDGRPLAFFDGPGGTQVPQRVIDAVVDYYRTSNANDGGAFVTSERSMAVVADGHLAIADLLNARSAGEIKFGQNMTSLTLHASRSIGASLEPGDEVVVTTLDHEANVGPWRSMAGDRGLTVHAVDIHDEDGTLDLEDLGAKLSSRTKLVAVGYASNAIGTINPVVEIVRMAHEVGALTYVDAVHWAPHGPIDVQALGTDFLACSVYKFFGPHLGVLYGRSEVLERLPSYKIRPAHDRFETGTQSFEAIAGARAAVEYIASIGERFGAAHVSAFAGMTGRRLTAHAGMRAIRAYEIGPVRAAARRSGRDRRHPAVGDRRPGPLRRADADGRADDRRDVPPGGRRGPRSAGHDGLGRRLLRHGAHRAARPRGDGRRAADRPDPLQHGRRGRSPARGPERDCELGESRIAGLTRPARQRQLSGSNR